MIDCVRNFIEKHKLLNNETSTVLVGLSGGADSVALLAVLNKLGYNCIALYCNFHLRGDESDRDEDFAREMARKFGVVFVKTDFDTVGYASVKHLSVEMAARELRYAWFEEQRKIYNAEAVAVAHHRDDNAETLLMNMIRGTGIRGMRGMLPKNGSIIRPLLSVTREEIIGWLSEQSLDYVTDSSNLSDKYTRNFIRLRVIPMLENLNPAVRQNIARTAEHLAEVESMYMYVVEEVRKKAWVADNILDTSVLFNYPSSETLLFEMLRSYGFTSVVCSDIFTAINREPGKIFFSDNWKLVTGNNGLYLSPITEEYERNYDIVYNIKLTGENTALSVPVNMNFKIIDNISSGKLEILKDKNVAYFDLDKLKGDLKLRHWRKGDWFVPFGMNGRKKISDYFTDHKFNRLEKDNIWLLVCNEDILWIVGERSDNRYRITNATKRVLAVNL